MKTFKITVPGFTMPFKAEARTASEARAKIKKQIPAFKLKLPRGSKVEVVR